MFTLLYFTSSVIFLGGQFSQQSSPVPTTTMQFYGTFPRQTLGD